MAKVSDELGIEAQLVQGDNGVFDVLVDGKIIFSKHSAGRFPDEQEIVQALRSLL